MYSTVLFVPSYLSSGLQYSTLRTYVVRVLRVLLANVVRLNKVFAVFYHQTNYFPIQYNVVVVQ